MGSQKYVQLDWYDTPLYYDIIFDEDTGKEADFMLAMTQRHAPKLARKAELSILEPACGSGRLMVELAKRGHRVSGFDLSQAMLDFAEKRLSKAKLKGELQLASMQDFRFRRKFDLAHCLVSTFKYLLDEDSARAHLQCVAKALRPGGLYILGFHLTEYEDTETNSERWVAKRGKSHVTCKIKGWPAQRKKRLERVRSRLKVLEGKRELRSETEWQFRTYDEDEVQSLFASVPELEHIATHDFCYELDPLPFDGEQLDCVFVLRKKS